MNFDPQSTKSLVPLGLWPELGSGGDSSETFDLAFERVFAEFGLQKKLYKCRPGATTPIDTYASRRQRG